MIKVFFLLARSKGGHRRTWVPLLIIGSPFLRDPVIVIDLFFTIISAFSSKRTQKTFKLISSKIILIIKERRVFWHKGPIKASTEVQTPISLVAYWVIPSSTVLVETLPGKVSSGHCTGIFVFPV